jgi:hypothetical protein
MKIRNKTVLGINKTVKKQLLDQFKPGPGVLGMDTRLLLLERKYYNNNDIILEPYKKTDM